MTARAVKSVLDQTYPGVRALVVIDGPNFLPAWNETKSRLADNPHLDRLDVVALAENTGGGGFYGHRIYAAFPHLVNEDTVFFLDQDNWYEPDHVASLIEVLQRPGNNQFAIDSDTCENCKHCIPVCPVRAIGNFKSPAEFPKGQLEAPAPPATKPPKG